jgi:hypothetical protein
MSENAPINVPAEVAYALEFIRESGRCNMFDRRCVQAVASESNEYATVVWLEDHKDEYGSLIINGWEAEDEPDDVVVCDNMELEDENEQIDSAGGIGR